MARGVIRSNRYTDRYLILNVGFLISSPLLGWESLSISLLFSIKKNKNFCYQHVHVWHRNDF